MLNSLMRAFWLTASTPRVEVSAGSAEDGISADRREMMPRERSTLPPRSRTVRSTDGVALGSVRTITDMRLPIARGRAPEAVSWLTGRTKASAANPTMVCRRPQPTPLGSVWVLAIAYVTLISLGWRPLLLRPVCRGAAQVGANLRALGNNLKETDAAGLWLGAEKTLRQRGVCAPWRDALLVNR